MKVFITGGLGQIGSHIAESMIQRGNEVLILDNIATGRKEHLKKHPLMRVVLGSVANRELLFELVCEFKPDVIVHAAASFNDPEGWYNDTITNCVGGANVVDVARRLDIGRFIYFQTSLCYGQKPVEKPITLSHPRVPSGSSYAISKTTNELYLELAGIDYVTFRLANVIGPRNVAGPLPIFYQRLKEGKRCTVTKSRRDFIFVKDLVKVVLKACDGIGSGAYNFSTGNDVSIMELYDNVVEVMGLKKYPIPLIQNIGADDVDSILLDPSRLIKDFGEIEFTPLNESVKEAVTYYEKYGISGEITHLNFKFND